MAQSQNGWGAALPLSSLLYTWTLPDGRRLRMRRGSAGFLLAHLAARFDRTVQDIDGGILDDWGYAYRPVRGYSLLSNHASGTAIDLNATKHSLGRENTFTPAQESQIQKLLGRYDGCIQWGGNYHNRKDEMHFELDRPLAACESVARHLLTSKMGERILKDNPTQRKVILS